MKPKPWNIENEMRYWNTVNYDNYMRRLADKLERLTFTNFVPENEPNMVAVIGGGKWNEALRIYAKGKVRVNIDPCARFFEESNNVKLLEGYCHNIPLEDDCVNLMFCIEVLDHCNSLEELRDSVQEMYRVMDEFGILFFEIPMRLGKKDHHPITLDVISFSEIEMLFQKTGFNVLLRRFVEEQDGITTQMYLVLQR